MLGSHNSMSYLPFKKWYMYPFGYIARCQSKTIQEQIEKYNIEVVDIRVGFSGPSSIEFRHGHASFKGDVWETMEYLNRRKMWVRLIYEDTQDNKKEREYYSNTFKFYCSEWKYKYPDIKFFGGVRKSDWKILYGFNRTLSLEQRVGSMISKLWAIWPWLYTVTHRKSRRNLHNKECLMLDYINYD